MVTLTRAGNVVVVRDGVREVAVVHPLNRIAIVGSSLAFLLLLATSLVSPHPASSLIVMAGFAAFAVAGLVWGLLGRTEVQISYDSIVTRTRLLGVTFASRAIPIAAAKFVRREQFVKTAKGSEVVRHRVIVGFEPQPQTLPVAVDHDGGEALAEMLERGRTKHRGPGA